MIPDLLIVIWGAISIANLITILRICYKLKPFTPKATKTTSLTNNKNHSQQKKTEEVGKSSQNLPVQAGCQDPQMLSGGGSALIPISADTLRGSQSTDKLKKEDN